MLTYTKAPITEAIVELRVSPPAPDDVVKGVESVLKKKYPQAEHQQALTVAITPTGSATSSARFEAIRFSKLDQSEIAVIRRNSLSRSMLPPYQGFAAFKASIEEDWTACRAVYRGRTISRIGTRFLNRIDIPINDQGSVNLAEYLRIMVVMPDLGYGPLINSSGSIIHPLDDASKKVVVNFGTMPVAVINHVSILLDIEVFQDVDLPQESRAIFAELDNFQRYKNEIFESLITDKARDLIRT